MRRFNTIVIFFVLCTLFTLYTPYTLHSQWYQQQVPINKSISGIKFTDTLSGWACTATFNARDTAYILHTSNGGINWLIQFRKFPFVFNCISIVDSLLGYVGADSVIGTPPMLYYSPRLYKTTNGGLRWDKIELESLRRIEYMQFLNRDTGWIGSFSFDSSIKVTTNGGISWHVRSNITGITAIFFLNYSTGWCSGFPQYTLYKSTNAGLNWYANYSLIHSVNSIFFLNEMTGWVSSASNILLFTSNGGINWINQIVSSNNSIYLFDVEFFNDSVGYVGADSREIFKTTNGGLIWGNQLDSGRSFHVSFVDSLNGWTGVDGIYHTSNGGGTIISVNKISDFIPATFNLYQNFPNPFNSQTTIQFSIKQSSHVTFKIYDIEGKELSPWIFGWEQDKLLKPGKYELQFDGKDMASGVYFYRIEVTDDKSKQLFSETKTMVLIK